MISSNSHGLLQGTFINREASDQGRFCTMELASIHQLVIKVKVRLSPVLNEIPRHENVLRSVGIDPCILDLGTRRT
jgi:hypothetical protein